MLSNSFLISALLGGTTSNQNSSPIGSLFGALAATASSRTILAQSQLNQSLAENETKVSGFDDLLAAVTGFQKTLDGFDESADINAVQATSSNDAVASASAGAGAGIGVYDLTVSNLARAQTNVSGAFADPDTTVVGTGTLTIQLGEYDSGSNTFTPGATGPVAINVTTGTLDDIADSINAAGAGVTASVVQNGSDSYLSLTSTSTGAANGFSLTVSDDDGNDTDMAGLSQLAFDPTSGAGAGKNLTETQESLDAAFTINGIATTSATNAGITISPNLTVNLFQTGSTTVTVAPDSTALTSAAQDFVDGFNELMGKIDALTASGGALANDPLAEQLAAALKGPLSDAFAATGSFDKLYQIGITPQADGTLALDTSVLDTAFAADSSGAVSLLNTAAQDFDAIGDIYAAGGGTISASSKAYQDNVQYLGSLLPSLQQMGDQTLQYSRDQITSALTQLYGASVTEQVLNGFSSDKSFSTFV